MPKGGARDARSEETNNSKRAGCERAGCERSQGCNDERGSEYSF